jgi:hypothetical protein
MDSSPWARMEADLAFSRATRARRWAALRRTIRRLAVLDETAAGAGPPGVTDIPVAAIAGTTEPNRVAQFDGEFRPKRGTRERWQRVWTAVQDGVALPPITVVRAGDGYAIRDGHHRVSVAKARGALTIRARVA